MEFFDTINNYKKLLSLKALCLSNRVNRTIDEEYELYYTIKKYVHGNDYPVIPINDKKFFEIVHKEIRYIESILPYLNKYLPASKFYKLSKRLFLIREWQQDGIVKDSVSVANKEYFELLEDELKFRLLRKPKSKRVAIENQIKIFYLKDEIQIRKKVLSMDSKFRKAEPVKAFEEKQDEYNQKLHFDIKIKLYEELIGLLQKKLECLKLQYEKIVDKNSLEAINLKIKIFRLETEIFAKEEFKLAYKNRESIL
jgi:hypothetical protein